jgi:hypothetical protein
VLKPGEIDLQNFEKKIGFIQQKYDVDEIEH